MIYPLKAGASKAAHDMLLIQDNINVVKNYLFNYSEFLHGFVNIFCHLHKP
jgi:hypothetical protein